MSKFMKAIAAIMLLVTVVCAACTKDPENGGDGGGSGPSPTEKGIYLGIIGFNYNLFPKEISLLDNSTKSSFTLFIDNLTTENLTALYYADYAGLKKLNQFGEPPQLTNVALVTFTDGLDNASLDDEERNPENYPTREAYLNALHNKIKTEQIHNLDVNAYTIGLRGNDVQDVAAFKNNLKKLASADNNVYEVTSMDEALQRFEEIAESLHWISVTTSLTLLVPPGYDDGMVLRFTFDQVNSAANSSLCIECTYKRVDNERRLENIHYIGFEQGAFSLSSVEKLPNGFYKFVFEQLEKVNGGGYITEEDKDRLKLYRRISTGWEPETEFDNSNQSSIVNEQNSALIMLVLDCTTSLGSQFSNLKTGAKNFVETLVNASNSGNTHRFTINVSANPTEGGTVSGGGKYNSGTSRTVKATANDGYTFTNWTENGNVVSTDTNYSFTLNTNRNLVANFTADAPEQYTISVSANPANGGTVSGGGSFDSGTTRTVTATANEGYSFTFWTENDSVVSTNANYTFTVNANRTLKAHFTANVPNLYTISVSASPLEGGTVSGGGSYNYGQSCTLTATPASGYTFVNWTKNGTVVSSNFTFTFTVTGSGAYVAHFSTQSYTITATADPTNGGSVSGGGSYNYGQSCTLTATPASGYTFVNWTKNGTVVSSNFTFTFTVTGSGAYVAHFTQQSQAPTGAINGVFSVSASQRVYFSQGNLQYKASNGTWRFATNQYDYIGEANSNISSSYNGYIDLFGWGTSGWDNGNVYYHPYDTQNNGNSSQGYGYGPTDGTNYTYNLTGADANADWGYNPINNGGGQADQWRTLTHEEWKYLFAHHTYGKHCVHGQNGVIILPDGMSTAAGFTSGMNGWTSVSDANWTNMHNAGAVFLPAAGSRYGTSVTAVGSAGYYWSASHNGSNGAWCLRVDDNHYIGNGYWSLRYLGQSVRLVCPAQ